MLDVDHFKKFNDTLGHTEGDDCLREVAQTMELNIRKDIDVAARFGGEEFIVLLPNAHAEIAYEIAERIRKAVELLPLCSAWPLTVSIGVATAYFGPGQDTAEALLHRADMALYQAKAGGRNLTIVAGEICQDYARLLDVEGCILVPGSPVD
jgi:diguanylate cyclase (GGDEF)-like protein